MNKHEKLLERITEHYTSEEFLEGYKKGKVKLMYLVSRRFKEWKKWQARNTDIVILNGGEPSGGHHNVHWEYMNQMYYYPWFHCETDYTIGFSDEEEPKNEFLDILKDFDYEHKGFVEVTFKRVKE